MTYVAQLNTMLTDEEPNFDKAGRFFLCKITS